MDAHLKERFAAAFIDVVKSELISRREVAVPGLGVFRVEHRPSTFEESQDGTVRITPPVEVITFQESVD